MAEHNDLGQQGEDMATKFLSEKGYKILERNWRFGKEEIDIIAIKDDVLAVVEVKTRFNNYFGEPEEFVSKSKQTHLIKAANAYIEKKNLDVEARFDIIGIILNQKQQKLNHIEAAFQPRW